MNGPKEGQSLEEWFEQMREEVDKMTPEERLANGLAAAKRAGATSEETSSLVSLMRAHQAGSEDSDVMVFSLSDDAVAAFVTYLQLCYHEDLSNRDLTPSDAMKIGLVMGLDAGIRYVGERLE